MLLLTCGFCSDLKATYYKKNAKNVHMLFYVFNIIKLKMAKIIHRCYSFVFPIAAKLIIPIFFYTVLKQWFTYNIVIQINAYYFSILQN